MRLKFAETEDAIVYPNNEIAVPEHEINYLVAYGEDYYDDEELDFDADQATKFDTLDEARAYAKELIKKGLKVSHIVKETIKRSRKEELFTITK